MEIKTGQEIGLKSGKTTIKWMPHGRYVVAGLGAEATTEGRRLASVGLIDPDTLSDSERQKLGFNTKAADIANTNTEDQKTLTVVAIGPEVMHTKIGDKIVLRGGNQSYTFKIEDKVYTQFGEFEILGNFID